jgi:hypothetical protein
VRLLAVTLAITLSPAAAAWAQQTFEVPAPQEQPPISIRRQASPTAPSQPPTTNVQTIPIAPPTYKGERPPPLESQTGCTLWHGILSGNDPTVLVEARICDGTQGNLTGVVQWSSLRSGYNVREVAGTRSVGGHLVMRDVRFLEYHPIGGWRFCLIDQYVLDQQRPDRLVGNYESSACNDNAKVELDRQSAIGHN